MIERTPEQIAAWHDAPDPKPSYRQFFGLPGEEETRSMVRIQWEDNKVGLALAGVYIVACIACILATVL